jgi:hypothetical protein
MTALTHAQCIDAFEHITRNVMWQEDGDPLLKALTNAGINDILSLLILDKQQIDALKYDDNGTMTLLAPGHKNMVTIFLAYVCHRIIICDPIMDDYLSVTSDEFEAYNGNDYLMLMNDAPTKSNAVAAFLEDSKQHLDTFSITKAIQHSNDTAVPTVETPDKFYCSKDCAHPQWQPRSKVQIYLGISPQHSPRVALVLNATTGLVTPPLTQNHGPTDGIIVNTDLKHDNKSIEPHRNDHADAIGSLPTKLLPTETPPSEPPPTEPPPKIQY